MKRKSHLCTAIILLVILAGFPAMYLNARPEDNTETVKASKDMEYLVPFFTYMGRPLNDNSERKITVLINHGYVIGYSKELKQPLWAAYRVSNASNFAKYHRPVFFHEDLRLPKSRRIGPATFPKYDRGHMVPNYAINVQYGQLAQLETFLMSNVCPQSKNLNRGVWVKLEQRIAKKYAPARGEIWVLAGPIFKDQVGTVNGVNGLEIPSHFFMIIVDVGGWNPYRPYKPYIMAFKFPQEISKSQSLSSKFLVSIDELEQLTGLNFFPDFSESDEKKYESKAAGGVWPID